MSLTRPTSPAVPAAADTPRAHVDRGTRTDRRRAALLALGARAVVGVVVIAIGFSVAPGLTTSDQFVVTSILVWAMVATSLNVVVGYAGQLNLAQGGFLALGAYVGVIGTGRWDWPGELSMLVAGAAALVVSGLLGLVIFRARGLHFALLTTGISIVVYQLLVAWRDQTGGAAGISTAGPLELGQTIKPFVVLGFEVRTGEDYLRVALVSLVVLVLAVSVAARRKVGLSWQAIRDDELLGASLGVPVERGKRTAFMVSSVLAALIGVFMGHWLGYVTPGSFDFSTASFEPLAMVILGGTGTLLGPIIGAVVIIGAPEVFRDLDEVSTLVYGSVLLLVVLVAPKGVMGVLGAVGRRLWRSVRPGGTRGTGRTADRGSDADPTREDA